MIAARAALACALLLGWQATATGEAIGRFKVAGWSGSAYTNDKTGAFDHCAASARYRSGISVAFSVSHSFRWSIRFGNPSWRLTPRERYPIAFSIDGRSPIGTTAIATSRTVIQVPLADNARLFDMFKRGDLLKVAAANQVFAFRLTDTSRILPVLLRCVRTANANPGMGRASTSSNPFTPQAKSSNPFAAPAPSAAADSKASSHAEATMIAANLMSLSGIKGFRILPREAALKINADAVWRAGTTIGTVRILPATATANVKGLSGLVIGSQARKCKGTFASGSLPVEGDEPMVRAFTSCKTGERTFTLYYLALTRKQGGYYLFSTGASGSEQPAKEADASIRQAVLKAIP